MFTYKVETVSEAITVLAATFMDVLNFKGTLHPFDPPCFIDEFRYQGLCYVEGVGKIIESYYYLANPNIYQKRLVSYHV